MKIYRLIFAAAALYNVLFGIWAAVFPLSFFDGFGLPAPRYPSLWACLGMVVGLYGIAYAYVAWKPERGDIFAAIGLAGKVLGPIGWLQAVGEGELPPQTFPLILANDLVWWFPFAFYLLRRLAARRWILVWIVAAVHLAACLALIAVRGGTELEPDVAERARWVRGAAPAWTAAWLLWSLASMSIVAFFAVWAAALRTATWGRRWMVTACVLALAGVLCDLSGEAINIVWLTRPDLDLAEYSRGARLYALLGPGLANGLYCTVGLLASSVSWRAGFLRGSTGLLGFLMWTVGSFLTAAAFLNHREAVVIAGTGVMALFILWALLFGWRMRLGSGR